MKRMSKKMLLSLLMHLLSRDNGVLRLCTNKLECIKCIFSRSPWDCSLPDIINVVLIKVSSVLAVYSSTRVETTAYTIFASEVKAKQSASEIGTDIVDASLWALVRVVNVVKLTVFIKISLAISADGVFPKQSKTESVAATNWARTIIRDTDARIYATFALKVNVFTDGLGLALVSIGPAITTTDYLRRNVMRWAIRIKSWSNVVIVTVIGEKLTWCIVQLTNCRLDGAPSISTASSFGRFAILVRFTCRITNCTLYISISVITWSITHNADSRRLSRAFIVVCVACNQRSVRKRKK